MIIINSTQCSHRRFTSSKVHCICLLRNSIFCSYHNCSRSIHASVCHFDYLIWQHRNWIQYRLYSCTPRKLYIINIFIIFESIDCNKLMIFSIPNLQILQLSYICFHYIIANNIFSLCSIFCHNKHFCSIQSCIGKRNHLSIL